MASTNKKRIKSKCIAPFRIVPSFEHIIENWVRKFYLTMDRGNPRAGDESGDTPDGIKIIFDGYSENEEIPEDERDLSFAVFIHKDSRSGKFPEHEYAFGMVMHRPSEEVCVYAWVNPITQAIEVILENVGYPPAVVRRIIFKTAFDIATEHAEISRPDDELERIIHDWLMTWRYAAKPWELTLDGVEISNHIEGGCEKIVIKMPINSISMLFNLSAKLEDHDALSKTLEKPDVADEIRSVQRQIAARSKELYSPLLYISLDIRDGKNARENLMNAYYGMYQYVWQLLDEKIVSDIWLVFTPQVVGLLDKQVVRKPVQGCLALAMDFEDSEVLDRLLDLSQRASVNVGPTFFGSRSRQQVGMYLALKFNDKHIVIDAEKGTPAFKKKYIMGVFQFALQTAITCSEAAKVPVMSFVSTGWDEERMFVQQDFDASKRGEDNRLAFARGYFDRSGDTTAREKFIVRWRKNSSAASDFYRYRLAVEELDAALKGWDESDKPHDLPGMSEFLCSRR